MCIRDRYRGRGVPPQHGGIGEITRGEGQQVAAARPLVAPPAPRGMHVCVVKANGGSAFL
eukprot:1177177-Rhodomonas_salina.1